MRQLHVQVPSEHAQRVLELANDHRAFSPTAVQAERADGGSWAMVFLNLPNDQIGPFAEAVSDEMDDAQFVIFPYGVLPIQTPLSDIKEGVSDVAARSPMELVLSSLQSVGSWTGMLRYALFSGVVAAYGVIFNSAFLLVAAMLIAPMGAPAMVSVVGSAIGDWRMAGRGLLRFAAAIAVLVVSAAALAAAYGLQFSTAAMESVSSLSAWGVAVALVAGAAGAQSQVESDRASLVTGTATGFLIAAALSPTSAVLGISLVLQRWQYARLMSFQLGLQYVAIVAGGWLALTLYGVRANDMTLKRGSRAWRLGLAGLAMAATVAMVAWQARQTPGYLKADLSVDAIDYAGRAVREIPGVRFIEANAHFTRSDLPDVAEEALLVNVVVVKQLPSLDSGRVEEDVRAAVKARVERELTGVLPLVIVSVLPGPDAPLPAPSP